MDKPNADGLVNYFQNDLDQETKANVEEDTYKANGQSDSNVQEESSLNDKEKELGFQDEKSLNQNTKDADKTEDANEESTENNEVEEGSIIDLIQKKVGYDLVDDEGNKLQFDDSPDGLARYIESVVEVAKTESQEETTNQMLDELMSTHPELPMILQHLKTYGSLEGYNSTVDYTSIQVNESNVQLQEQLVYSDLINSGVNESVAMEMITLFKNKGELLNQARNSLLKLQNHQMQQYQQMQQEQEYRQEQERARVGQMWNEVESYLDKGNVKGYTIPTNEKVSFAKYLAEDTGNGLSQDMIDAQNLDIETRMLLSYFRFKKFDLTALVREAVGEAKVNSLKEWAKKTPPVGKTSTSKNFVKGSVEDLQEIGDDPTDIKKMMRELAQSKIKK